MIFSRRADVRPVVERERDLAGVRRSVHGAAAEPRRVGRLRADVAGEDQRGRDEHRAVRDGAAAQRGSRRVRARTVVAAVAPTTAITDDDRATTISDDVVEREHEQARRSRRPSRSRTDAMRWLRRPQVDRGAGAEREQEREDHAVATTSSRWARSQAAVDATAPPTTASVRFDGSRRDANAPAASAARTSDRRRRGLSAVLPASRGRSPGARTSTTTARAASRAGARRRERPGWSIGAIMAGRAAGSPGST